MRVHELRDELAAGALIQAALLPPDGRNGTIEYSGLFRPATLLAGDTYNLFKRSDHTVGFYMIDVAGHGLPAALVSAAAQNAVSNALVNRGPNGSLDQVVSDINNAWPSYFPHFTMVISEIDLSYGRGVLVQAGHPHPILLRASGGEQELGRGGLPIGMFANSDYEDSVFSLEQGDQLFLFSDGLVDSRDPSGEMLGLARLCDLLAAVKQFSPRDAIRHLDTTLRRWQGSFKSEDDVSALMIQFS